MKRSVIVTGLLLCSLFSSTAHGHPGGLDSKGGHFNRKTGEYHYHRQPTPPAAAPKTLTRPAVFETVAAAASASFPLLNTMQGVKDRLAQCRVIQDSQARLACFETLTDALISSPTK